MIPLGIGIGIIMPLFNLIVQNAFPQKMLGVVSSSAQLFRGIGSVVGIAVMGTYLNHSIAQKLESVGSSSFIEQLKQSRHLTTIDANSNKYFLKNLRLKF